jgi:DNA modification methylase
LPLARWWTRYICPIGGTVLDPFNGVGTMGIAALTDGRRYVGIEQDADYCRIARARLTEAADRAGEWLTFGLDVVPKP